jgi:hypothetical protein
MNESANFLYTKYSYHGHFTPENLVFNANLQEFAQRVGYISALETGGKLSPGESFEKLQLLWQQLSSSAQNLGIKE